MMSPAESPVWELVEITKTFPGVVANDRVSLTLRGGEIHGLLGENGSGKSTLIKTLSGAHQPDSGRIMCNGQTLVFPNPTAARQAGIATVFQEFSLVPTLSVAENIHLGRLPRRGWGLDWRAIHDGARKVLASMEVDLAPDSLVGSLSVAEQQLVEIAKALASKASLLILDEPTSALGIEEIARLHKLLRRLKKQGTATLYVSHRLAEVVELVDCATIMKDGRVVSTAETTTIAISHIVKKMVGNIAEHYPKERNAKSEILLRVDEMTTASRLRRVSFEVHRGEIFGLAGVLGSGRTEVARALFGLDPLTHGQMIWKGRAVRFASPQEAIAAGLAFVPENRKYDGLFFNFAGFPNITIAALDRLGRFGTIDLKREATAGRAYIRDLAITSSAGERDVGMLSGGNQQKIIIARWLFAGAELFILDEPTQGIDIGAKVAVYTLMNRLTASGKAIILISSDHDELLNMADRVGIMSHGRMIAVRSAKSLSKVDIQEVSARPEEMTA